MEPLIPTEVETERLLLRRPVESDVAGLLPLFDAQVVRYLDGKVPTFDDMWRAVATWLGHWDMRGYGMYTWVDRVTGTVVGRGGLWNPSGWPQLEVGWTLGRHALGPGLCHRGGARRARPRLGAPVPRLGVQRHPPRQRGRRRPSPAAWAAGRPSAGRCGGSRSRSGATTVPACDADHVGAGWLPAVERGTTGR